MNAKYKIDIENSGIDLSGLSPVTTYDADGGADFAIQLSGVSSLVVSDFAL